MTTLQTEIEAESYSHRVGYYVAFDGIEARLSTHAFTDGGTYLAVMKDMPSGAGQILDRKQNVVKPGGFSFECRETPTLQLGQFLSRRGGIESPLVAGVDNAAAIVKVVDGLYNNGSTVYVGGETIILGTYTASPSPRYTGCTRGAYGSETTDHQVGTAISDKPRSWLNRRGVLYEVNLDTGTSAAIRSGLVSESPSHNQGAWSFDFIDLSTILNRPIGSGWSEEPVLDVDFSAWNEITFYVADANLFGGTNSKVRASTSDGQIFYQIKEKNTGVTPNTLTAYSTWLGGSLDRLTADIDVSSLTLRQVMLTNGDPALVALKVMLSRLGDGANHATHDKLAGIAANTGDGTQAKRRLGAGIPASYVDVDSWTAAARGANIRFVVDEEMSILDFLVREVLWRLGGFIYINASGQLAFRRYDPATADGSLVTYDESDLASTDLSFIDDEGEILSGATVECNWDAYARKYTHKTDVIFNETQDIYGDKRNWLRISSRSMRIGTPDPANLSANPISESVLTSLFLRQYARTRQGLRRIRIAFKWQWHLRFFVGYRFKLSLDNIPNGQGGLGFTSQICEAVSVAPATEAGRVIVECELMPVGKMIAPALVVSGISGLDVYGYGDLALFPSVNKQVPQFPVGCKVRIFDSSATPPYSVSEVQTVTANAVFGTVTLDALPSSFPLAAGDYFKLVWSADTGSPNGLGADVSDYAMIADANDEVDGDRDLAARWE